MPASALIPSFYTMRFLAVFLLYPGCTLFHSRISFGLLISWFSYILLKREKCHECKAKTQCSDPVCHILYFSSRSTVRHLLYDCQILPNTDRVMFSVLVNSLNSTCAESTIQKCTKLELFKIILTNDKNIRIIPIIIPMIIIIIVIGKLIWRAE